MEKNKDFSKLSKYKCDECGNFWEDSWDSFCDDECGECGNNCSPIETIDLEGKK